MLSYASLRIRGWVHYEDGDMVALCNVCADEHCRASLHTAANLRVEYEHSWGKVVLKPVIEYTWSEEISQPGEPIACDKCLNDIDADLVQCVRYTPDEYGLDRCRCEDCAVIDEQNEPEVQA